MRTKVAGTDAETWGGMVRSVALSYGVQVDDDEIEFILWEQTAFPLADRAYTVEQVKAYFERFGLGGVLVSPEQLRNDLRDEIQRDIVDTWEHGRTSSFALADGIMELPSVRALLALHTAVHTAPKFGLPGVWGSYAEGWMGCLEYILDVAEPLGLGVEEQDQLDALLRDKVESKEPRGV